jgi:hypothetical protein
LKARLQPRPWRFRCTVPQDFDRLPFEIDHIIAQKLHGPIPRRTSYRWLKEEAWARSLPEEPARPVPPVEALPEEKQAVLDYARKHPELRHRELAWRLVDEDVACLSPAPVDRILKEANLVCPWRRRAEEEKATRPNQRG